MPPSEGNQIGFLMTTTVEQMVPQDRPLMKIARSISFGFVREKTEELYAQGQGRPAYPPEQLFKVLLLESRYASSFITTSSIEPSVGQAGRIPLPTIRRCSASGRGLGMSGL